MPTSTATVRSASTVSAKVSSHTTRRSIRARSRPAISRHSPMFQATTSSTAASVASGTKAASGASAKHRRRQREGVDDRRRPGVRAPARMLVAVRAIAPVTGMPPTIGTTRLAMPCATSSALESCRSPRHPRRPRPPTTGSRPRPAAPLSAPTAAAAARGRPGTRAGAGSASRAGCLPKRDPIVSTGRPKSHTAAVPATRARIAPGIRGVSREATRITASDIAAQGHGRRIGLRQGAAQRASCARRTRSASTRVAGRGRP